jgi:hypothetical protein
MRSAPRALMSSNRTHAAAIGSLDHFAQQPAGQAAMPMYHQIEVAGRFGGERPGGRARNSAAS